MILIVTIYYDHFLVNIFFKNHLKLNISFLTSLHGAVGAKKIK